MNLLNLLVQSAPNILALLLVVIYLENRIHRLEVNLREEIVKVERNLREAIGKLSERVAGLEAHFGSDYKVAEPKPDFE